MHKLIIYSKGIIVKINIPSLISYLICFFLFLFFLRLAMQKKKFDLSEKKKSFFQWISLNLFNLSDKNNNRKRFINL